MTAVYTNTFKAALSADNTLMDTAQVQMVMFDIAADLVPGGGVDGAPVVSSPYAAIDTIAGLEAQLGWGPSITQTVTATLPTAATVVGTTYFATTNDTGFVLPVGFPDSVVKVVAFVYKGPKTGSVVYNKVMFITDTPVRPPVLMRVGDGVIPAVDPVRGRILVSWSYGDPIEGPLVRQMASPPFEAARTQHVWIYPQRINMIANPSFEEDTDYWRTNGAESQITTTFPIQVNVATTANLAALSGLLTVDTVVTAAGNRVLVKNQADAKNNGIYVVAAGAWTRATDADAAAELKDLKVYVKGGSQRGTGWICRATDDPIVVGTSLLPFELTVASGGGNFAGHFTGSPVIVIESNMFPLVERYNERGWTIQMRVRSDKEVKVGLITWTGDFVETAADWGDPEEVWLPNGGWLPIRTCRSVGEVSTGMLRIEGQGTYIDLDLVCVEFGTLPWNFSDWPYFDGDNLFGAVNDFSWYERPHKSYSCWYNDRDAVMGRLFAWNMSAEDESPGGVITDEEAAKQGLADSGSP